MYTLIESALFTKRVYDYLTDEEYGAFQAFLCAHPAAGEVVPGSGGVRKIRWMRKGQGKRGGVRMIYFNRLAVGEIWLLVIYAKAKRETIPPHILKAIREEIEDES